jgi:catalase
MPATYDLAEQILDAIEGIYGQQGPHRAVHAKGTLLIGEFTPAPEGARLSRAAHLAGPPVKATVRLSNGGGKPDAPDTAPDGRGVAIKLYLPDGSTTDMVGLSLPCFFTRTPEDFLEFTRARKPDPATGQPDMAVLGAFLGDHPEAGPALQAAVTAGVPESYARQTYNSIHSFRYSNDEGESQFGRWRLIPEAGEATVEPDVLGELEPDFLQDEIVERAGRGEAAFTVVVRIAAEADPVDDPTVAWPEGERAEITIGRLELTGPETGREQDGDVLVFDPTRVPDGIEISGDPILAERSRAYSVSVERRSGATRPPL